MGLQETRCIHVGRCIRMVTEFLDGILSAHVYVEYQSQESRGNSSGHRGRHNTRAATGDKTRESRQFLGAPSPAGTARIERALDRQAGTLPGRRLTTRQETRDSRPLRGAPSPKPPHQHLSQVLPYSQVGGEHSHIIIGTLGKDNRSSMAPAASQFRADGG